MFVETWCHTPVRVWQILTCKERVSIILKYFCIPFFFKKDTSQVTYFSFDTKERINPELEANSSTMIKLQINSEKYLSVQLRQCAGVYLISFISDQQLVTKY